MYNQMTTHDFDLKNADGEFVSIGYCYGAFGIIVQQGSAGEGRSLSGRDHQL